MADKIPRGNPGVPHDPHDGELRSMLKKARREQPEITVGQCRGTRYIDGRRQPCPTYGPLANGLCMDCWDRQSGYLNNGHPPRLRRQGRVDL